MTDVPERDGTRWWHRLRSALALAGLLVALGVAAAAVLGITAVAITSVLDQALG